MAAFTEDSNKIKQARLNPHSELQRGSYEELTAKMASLRVTSLVRIVLWRVASVMHIIVNTFYLCIYACRHVDAHARVCLHPCACARVCSCVCAWVHAWLLGSGVCAILCMHECVRVHVWGCLCECTSMQGYVRASVCEREIVQMWLHVCMSAHERVKGNLC